MFTMSTGVGMGLCALIYVLLLIFNRKRCFSFVSGNKVSVVMILYLLTIGLTVTPTVNAVMIVIVLLSTIFQKKKMNRNVYMSRGSFILILLVSTYLILNTIIIYSNKKYNPEFNPYIGLIEMITYFLYFIALSILDLSERDRQLLIEDASIYLIGVFIIGMLGIIDKEAALFGRMSAIFRNPNLLGVYSAIIFALNFQYSHSIISKRIKLMIIGLSFILVLLSQSRVAWIGIIVYFMMVFFKSNINSKLKYILMTVMLSFIMLIIFKDEILYLFQTRIVTAFNMEDFSTSDRVGLIKAALDIYEDHKFFGTGIRSFLEEVKKYRYSFWSLHVMHPHNAYLEMLQSLGLAGFLLYLVTIVNILIHKSNKDRNFIFVFIMFLAMGLLNRLFNEYSTTIFLWTVLAFI